MLRLDPSREIAWRHLGYKKYGSRWIKPEEAAAERREAEEQKHANRHWKPRLERLHEGLQSTNATRREQAEHSLAEVNDPRAVSMVWNVLATGGERSQIAAVKVLGQIDGAPASNSLAALAVFSPFPNVHQQAIAALVSRDPRDVIGRLINLVRRPFKYSVRPATQPGTTGELFVDGERFDFQRLYQLPALDMRFVPGTTSPVNLIQAAQANNLSRTVFPNNRNSAFSSTAPGSLRKTGSGSRRPNWRPFSATSA